MHPLLDERFIGALASAGGASGYGDRTTAVQRLFGALLPEATAARRTKAEFGLALWRAKARLFAERWDGSGVDPELVDVEALRQAWRAENPIFGSTTPLHAAWLHVSGGSPGLC